MFCKITSIYISLRTCLILEMLVVLSLFDEIKIEFWAKKLFRLN